MPLGMRPSLLAFEEFNPAFGVSGRRRNFIPLRAGGNVDLERVRRSVASIARAKPAAIAASVRRASRRHPS